MEIRDEKRVVGDNIRHLRKMSGASVDELASNAGCARGYWYELETGVANFTIEILQKVARSLGVTVRDLLTVKKRRAG